MDLRNFEYTAGSAAPIAGATVVVYDAILTGVHGAAKSFTDHNGVAGSSTTTNTDGMWEANGLAAGYYDVKITYNSQIKWYKGMTRHSLGHMYDDQTPDANRNLIPNGGFENVKFYVANGTGTIPTGYTGTPNACDGWDVYGGSGDAGTHTYTNGVTAPNSQNAQYCSYNRSAGQCNVTRLLPTYMAYQLRGMTVRVSFQVYQETASSGLFAFITDGIGTGTSVATSVVGSWVTVTAQLTVSLLATSIRLGVATSRSDTGVKVFYVDNAELDIGSLTPTYVPEVSEFVFETIWLTLDDSVAPALAATGNTNQVTVLLNNIINRLKAISGGSDWRAAPAATLASLLTAVNLCVLKAGDSMSGNLTFTGGGQIGVVFTGTGIGGKLYDVSTSQTVLRAHNNLFGIWSADTTQNYASFSSALQIFRTAISTGTGTFSGAITAASAALTGALTAASATLTGALNAASAVISGALGANSAVVTTDLSVGGTVTSGAVAASTVTGTVVNGTSDVRLNSTSVVARGIHTGTQLAATISDFATAVAAVVVTEASTLTGSWTAILLRARANHTGTQLAATISDFATAGNLLWSALAHTHTQVTGDANSWTQTYAGNSAGARAIVTGFSWTPTVAIIQVIAGGSGMWIQANHDSMGIGTANLSGGSFSAGVVTVPSGANVSGLTYRVTTIGIP